MRLSKGFASSRLKGSWAQGRVSRASATSEAVSKESTWAEEEDGFRGEDDWTRGDGLENERLERVG